MKERKRESLRKATAFIRWRLPVNKDIAEKGGNSYGTGKAQED
jgi:hypothetical protein